MADSKMHQFTSRRTLQLDFSAFNAEIRARVAPHWMADWPYSSCSRYKYTFTREEAMLSLSSCIPLLSRAIVNSPKRLLSSRFAVLCSTLPAYSSFRPLSHLRKMSSTASVGSAPTPAGAGKGTKVHDIAQTGFGEGTNELVSVLQYNNARAGRSVAFRTTGGICPCVISLTDQDCLV